MAKSREEKLQIYLEEFKNAKTVDERLNAAYKYHTTKYDTDELEFVVIDTNKK